MLSYSSYALGGLHVTFRAPVAVRSHFKDHQSSTQLTSCDVGSRLELSIVCCDQAGAEGEVLQCPCLVLNCCTAWV
jgi:hypothetical protein